VGVQGAGHCALHAMCESINPVIPSPSPSPFPHDNEHDTNHPHHKLNDNELRYRDATDVQQLKYIKTLRNVLADQVTYSWLSDNLPKGSYGTLHVTGMHI
jgi:hypothetical protein